MGKTRNVFTKARGGLAQRFTQAVRRTIEELFVFAFDHDRAADQVMKTLFFCRKGNKQKSNIEALRRYKRFGKVATTGAYKAPYLQSGAPLIFSSNGTNLSMLSGAMSFSANSLIVEGGGGSGIVSVGATDSGGTGYRLLRVPN